MRMVLTAIMPNAPSEGGQGHNGRQDLQQLDASTELCYIVLYTVYPLLLNVILAPLRSSSTKNSKQT